MPNIEIHGFRDRKANELKNTIFALFKYLSFAKDMVITIYLTTAEDEDGNSMPFIRLVSTPENFIDEIIRKLQPFNIDLEVLELKSFYPKK